MVGIKLGAILSTVAKVLDDRWCGKEGPRTKTLETGTDCELINVWLWMEASLVAGRWLRAEEEMGGLVVAAYGEV